MAVRPLARVARAAGLTCSALVALVAIVAIVALDAVTTHAAPAPEPIRWSDFLSRAEVGATAWSKAHPTWDGRGVVVAVLDTGVDPTVPGLRTLPDGTSPKVIDARDFSGEGHVAMTRVAPDADGLLRHDGLALRGAGALMPRPLPGQSWWVGVFAESALANSGAADLDRDGHDDDRFGVVAWRSAPDGVEVVVVDRDGDGDLGDEKVMRAYADEPVSLTFGAPVDPKKDRAPLTFQVTPALDDKRVELHFDGGGHGTHCAGIAAGFGVDGQPGFDGIAPGARVLSLKIGHDGLSGGATTAGSMADAIRFASRWATAHATPVVINLSYGIGSEIEGGSDIERVLDEALQDNPWLSAALSAGNEGPGLSSVGTPAGAMLAWTAGAIVPAGAWDALVGNARARPKQTKIFDFSSRGGELDKPDGLTPGIAWSTVPPFMAKSVMNGTSMAAPQAAGVIALLWSALTAEARPCTFGLVKRALRETAKPIAGYSSLEQGRGVVDLAGAWALAARLCPKRDAAGRGGAGAALEVAGWALATKVPHRPGGEAPVSYWRVGGYAPDRDEPVSFRVTPRFYGGVSELAKSRHVDVLTLAPDVAWLSTDRDTIAIRGDDPIDVAVAIDRGALARAGHHVGRVRARLGGVTAFELVVVVVVPERFDGAWERTFAARLEAGDVARVFVQAPPGATSMRARLTIDGREGSAWLVPFDPEGRHVEAYEHRAWSRPGGDGGDASFVAAGKALDAGVWELTMLAPLENRTTSALTLTVSYVALEAPEVVAPTQGADGALRARVPLTNRMAEPFVGSIDAMIDAYERTRALEVSGERGTLATQVAPGVVGVDLELELAADVWARMSDVAIDIVDGDGRTVAQGAFGQRRARLSFDAAPGRYEIVVVGALVDRDDAGAWKVKVLERHRLAAPIALDARLEGGGRTIHPGVTVDVVLAAPQPSAPPDGFVHRAVVALTRRDGALWTRLTLPLKAR